MTLNELHNLEHNHTVADILMSYCGVQNTNDLINELIQDCPSDLLGYWATDNEMSYSDMFNLIEAHLYDPAKFFIAKENDNHNECYLSINRVPLFMDWLTVE